MKNFNALAAIGAAGAIGQAAMLGLVNEHEAVNGCFAFDDSNFDPTGSGSKGGLKVATYVTTTDNTAAVETDGYFDSTFVSTTLTTGDFLLVKTSNGAALYNVTVAGTDVALSLKIALA